MDDDLALRLRFFDALVRAEVRVWNALEPVAAAGSGISLGQLTALRLVADRRGQGRVQDLADDIGITVGAASKVVDRLERAGLARRTPHPTDRRSSLLAVTDEGAATLAAGTAAISDGLRAHTRDLDAAVLADLVARLDQVTAATRTPPAG